MAAEGYDLIASKNARMRVTMLGKVQEMAATPDLQSLPPGPRAVMAGLLRLAGGDQTLAYQIAEAVPAAILIQEELHFLKLAL